MMQAETMDAMELISELSTARGRGSSARKRSFSPIGIEQRVSDHALIFIGYRV